MYFINPFYITGFRPTNKYQRVVWTAWALFILLLAGLAIRSFVSNVVEPLHAHPLLNSGLALIILDKVILYCVYFTIVNMTFSKLFTGWEILKKSLILKLLIFFVFTSFSQLFFASILKDNQFLDPFLSSSLVELTAFMIIFNFHSWKDWQALNPEKFKVWFLFYLPFITLCFKFLISIVMVLLLGDKMVTSGVNEQKDLIAPNHLSSNLQFLTLFLGVGIISPIVEELLFRGIIFTRLKSRVSVRNAALISSLLFGLGHIIPVLVVFTFFLGLLLCYVYEKHKNISYTMIMHIFNNSLPFILMLFGNKIY